MTQIIEELKHYEESQPDPQFRRHELGREDLNVFAHMITIREVFAAQLDDQKRLILWQKKMTLDDWLREKREEEKDTIFFDEIKRYAYIERKQILSRLKQWIQTYIS